MTVSGIQHHGVYALCTQSGDAVQGIGGDADAGGYPEAALGVLAGGRITALLHDVLIGDEAHDEALVVYHGEFLHLVLLQDRLHILAVGAGSGDAHKAFGSHDVAHGDGKVLLETDVTVGDDTHQATAAVGDGDAANVVFLHQAKGIGHGLVLVNGNGVGDHAVLRTLYLTYLTGLGGDAHILVNDADSAFARQGDGHGRLGDRNHGGRHDGDVEGNVAGETGVEVYHAGEHLRISRDEKDIVECEAFHGNSVIYKGHISGFLQS